jgi:hypothetical protein
MHNLVTMLYHASQKVLKSGSVLEILDSEFVLRIIQETLDGGNCWPMHMSGRNWMYNEDRRCSLETTAFHSTSSHALHRMIDTDRRRLSSQVTMRGDAVQGSGAHGMENTSGSVVYSPRRPPGMSYMKVSKSPRDAGTTAVCRKAKTPAESTLEPSASYLPPSVLSSLIGTLLAAVPQDVLSPSHAENLQSLMHDAHLENIFKACEESQMILASSRTPVNGSVLELEHRQFDWKDGESAATTQLHVFQGHSSLSNVGHASFVNPATVNTQLHAFSGSENRSANLVSMETEAPQQPRASANAMAKSTSQSMLLKVKARIQKRRDLARGAILLPPMHKLCGSPRNASIGKIKTKPQQDLEPLRNLGVSIAAERVRVLRSKAPYTRATTQKASSSLIKLQSLNSKQKQSRGRSGKRKPKEPAIKNRNRDR